MYRTQSTLTTWSASTGRKVGGKGAPPSDRGTTANSAGKIHDSFGYHWRSLAKHRAYTHSMVTTIVDPSLNKVIHSSYTNPHNQNSSSPVLYKLILLVQQVRIRQTPCHPTPATPEAPPSHQAQPWNRTKTSPRPSTAPAQLRHPTKPPPLRIRRLDNLPPTTPQPNDQHQNNKHHRHTSHHPPHQRPAPRVVHAL